MMGKTENAICHNKHKWMLYRISRIMKFIRNWIGCFRVSIMQTRVRGILTIRIS